MAHTPGPWTLGPHNSGPHEVHGTPVVNKESLILAIASNKEADAHLIAAAPDLLVALERLLAEAIPNYDVGKGLRERIGLGPSNLEPAVEQARAAIAKATPLT